MGGLASSSPDRSYIYNKVEPGGAVKPLPFFVIINRVDCITDWEQIDLNLTWKGTGLWSQLERKWAADGGGG